MVVVHAPFLPQTSTITHSETPLRDSQSEVFSKRMTCLSWSLNLSILPFHSHTVQSCSALRCRCVLYVFHLGLSLRFASPLFLATRRLTEQILTFLPREKTATNISARY